MSFEGADFGFVGDAYAAPMLLQDAQTCINFYVEIDQQSKAKEPLALLGTPGLNPVLSTQAGAVRGAWVLPGGTQALFVTGNTLYLATVTVPATQTSIAQFSVAPVGTLLTNSGPVSIRDNGVRFGGAAGFAIIVDGQYGYYYLLSGASQTTTFPGSLSIGSPTITFPGVLPLGLIVASTPTLSDVSSVIPAGTTVLAVDTVGLTLTMSANATGNSFTDTVTLTIPAFGRITDAGFLGADRVAFIEGWLIFNQPNTRTFYTTGPTAYSMLFPGSFFALKDSSTDNLVTLEENVRELWLIGERTTEVWFNAGSANFAFQRLPGIGPQIGCSAKHSLSRFGDSLAWLARNEQGENFVLMTAQYAYERISNHAIEHAIASYPLVSDAIGYSYQEEGHLFYVLTFPTADVTWVFDGSTRMWHRRASWDPVAGVYHRHRSNCFVNFADLRLVGDYTSGQVHQMSRSIYTDAGNPLRAQRRAPHVWSRQDRKRVFQSALQVEFTPGVGLSSGQGSNPQAMLRWSNDGSFTWSNEHWTGIGLTGQTKNRAIWRRLGMARDRVYELNYSDPTPRDIVGATLFGQAESDEEAA